MEIIAFPCKFTDRDNSYFDGRNVYISFSNDIDMLARSHFHEMGHAVCKFGYIGGGNWIISWIADLISETIAYRFERIAFAEYNKIYNEARWRWSIWNISISDPHFLAWYISFIPIPIFIKEFYKK